VPLKLVTGPANAAKAGAVLGALRDRLAAGKGARPDLSFAAENGAGESPILAVPSFEDVEHSRRELAERGAVFGATVLRFGALFELIATRTGHRARRASQLQRMLIVEEAVRTAHLDVLAASSQRPGFARAAARFTAELERSMVEPASLTRALRKWAGNGPRRPYAEEVAEVYRRYRDGLDAAGLEDEELFAWRALEALRAEPGGWGATPVFVYGFDDFTRVELATLEELSRHAGAEVTVSLPWEPGREAFRATSTIRQDLEERGAVVDSLEALADHYAPGSRQALHALERTLFEDVRQDTGARSGGVVRLHRAGGERAEIELCAAEVLRMLREGTPPGEIAVVFRAPEGYASMLEQVFGSYGIPYSIDRSVPLAHTAIGHGLLALLRCALLKGSADDLLAYLRTPGLLTQPRLADRLEGDVRRAGASTAVAARAVWESTENRWPLEELDRLAASPDTAACLSELDACLSRLFSAPHRRRAPVLRGAESDDARAFVAAHGALAELRAVIGANPRMRLDHRRVHDTLAELPVRIGEKTQPDRVQVASPLTIRARRFAAVLVCGLQEDEFPRRAVPEAFLPDADRRDIARASGLRLPLREDQLERERYLFYVCTSRAERELVLSTRYCDEEGNPQAPSFFVDDAREVLPDLDEHVRVRSLADVTWPLEQAPTPAEWERAVARSGPRRPVGGASALTAEPALREVARREIVSAGALERFAGCPVKWLVEDVLDPEKLEPDPEQMVRGSYAHRVLELSFRRLRERTGSRRVTPANLAEAERLVVEALEECQGEFRLSPNQVRVRAAVRRLEFDLLRYLRHEAGRDGLFEPEHLELRFGFADSEHESVELEGGLRVRGVIDRVDVHGGWALVRDYKSGKVDSYKAADWESKNRFQAALYMMVVERLLGLRAAGGVYVPLSGAERRPRGMVAAEALNRLGSDFYDNDVKPQDEFAESTAWAQGAIADAADRMRTGRIEPCPDTCAYRGGCSHPSICRVEA